MNTDQIIEMVYEKQAHYANKGVGPGDLQIVLNPAALNMLVKELCPMPCGPVSPKGRYLLGLPYITRTGIAARERTWIWDRSDPFVEYEESDANWCQFFDIGGRWSMVEPPAAFVMRKDTLAGVMRSVNYMKQTMEGARMNLQKFAGSFSDILPRKG